MSNHLFRILCLIVFSALYGCSSGSSEGGISGTGGPPKIIVNGQAEKGPFLKRSEVTYHYINEAGETLSEDFSTTTSDDMGSFSLGLNDPGLIEIRVSGYHYDEINNQISDGLLALNGLYIADDEEAQAARVNLLTHIIHDRVLMLMADENLSAGLAVTQAEQELLGELESIIPKSGINDFSQLSVYNRENTNENGNAYLLLFSAALYQHAINNTPEGSSLSGQLTGVLNVLTDDFEDGALDASSQLIDGLALAIQQLDATEIVSNLEDRSNDVLGETLDVPDFSGFIGQFLITFPAEDALLSETTPVRLEVPSGLKNVTLDLMVDGLVIDSITEAPYEFTWDPYYWSTDSTSRHTLLIKASNAVGAEIVSNLVPVSVLASSNNQLSLTSPVDSQIVENSDSVSLQWGHYQGASQYRVEVANTSSFTNVLYETSTSTNQFDLTGLDVGNYYWRIQAIDIEEREGAWSESIGFAIQAPQAPELQMPSFGTVIRNTVTPTLSWSAVENAASYQVQISINNDFSNVIADETLSLDNFSTSALVAGNYFWRVRSIDGVGHESEFSSTNAFVVEGPLPPEGITSEWSSNGDQYDVTMNWQTAEYASSYEIQFGADSAFTMGVTNISVASESADISLEVGEYFARVRSINSGVVVGDWSESIVFSVGLFRTQLGGSGNDRAKQMIVSKDGGYIILGVTHSREVSETVDSNGDDWIFKIDEQGDLEWQFILSASGGSKLSDLIELSDGSVIAVGGDYSSKQALALKLDADGNRVWDVIYTPSNANEISGFQDVVEVNGQLYVSSKQSGAPVCSGCSFRTHYYLHTLSLMDGAVSDSIDIPGLTGLTIHELTELEATSENGLLLSGFALLEGGGIYGAKGAFIQVLDSNLTQLTTWNNVGDDFYFAVGDAIELSNGRFAVVGQGILGEVAISVVNNDGSDFRTYRSDYLENYGRSQIVAGNGGEIYGLFVDADRYNFYPPTFMSFDSNVVLESQSYLLDFMDNSDPVGLVQNSDETFTFLINEGQGGNNNNDIFVVKRVMN